MAPSVAAKGSSHRLAQYCMHDLQTTLEHHEVTGREGLVTYEINVLFRRRRFSSFLCGLTECERMPIPARWMARPVVSATKLPNMAAHARFFSNSPKSSILVSELNRLLLLCLEEEGDYLQFNILPSLWVSYLSEVASRCLLGGKPKCFFLPF